MPKYHVNERGEPGMCRARKRCPFGDLAHDHYGSLVEARTAYEAQMRGETFGVKTPVMLTTAMVEKLAKEEQNLLVGAVQRCLAPSISLSAGSPMAYWQAAYDSSPAGRLWLERKRLEGVRVGRNPDYDSRKANLDVFEAEVNASPISLDLPDDPGDVFEHDFSTSEFKSFPEASAMDAQKTKLALLSAAWMSNLTPEEVEAVSWVTSNGASVMNHHLSGKEPEIWGYHVYAQKHINESVKHFRAAMAKAPVLEEPVIIYRGTGEEHIIDGFLDRPASSSLSGDSAKGFRNGEGEAVLLEIKTRKLATPVGMSAWTTAELEVLAPLREYRKVGDFTALRPSDRSVKKRDVDPKYDSVRIIQLEHIG